MREKLQDGPREGRQSYWPFRNPCKEQLLSFFDDDEETAQRPAGRAPRAPQRPSPRRPERAAGALPLDQHTLMVRRRDRRRRRRRAADHHHPRHQRLPQRPEDRRAEELQPRSQPARAGIRRTRLAPAVLGPSGAGGKSALNVEVQVDQLRVQAQDLATRVKKLSAPGDMADAQRNLLLAFDLRAEAVTKIAALTPTALGGQGKQAIAQIAGDMEIFLASDVHLLPARRAADPAGAEGRRRRRAHHRPLALAAQHRLARTDDRRKPHHRQIGRRHAGSRSHLRHARQLAHRRQRRRQHAREPNRRSTTSAAAATRRSPSTSKTAEKAPRRTSRSTSP